MTDFDKLDQQYRDEGWGHITDDALPGVRPSNVESQARAVATWCVGRIAALEAKLAEKVKVKPLAWRDGKFEAPCIFGLYVVVRHANRFRASLCHTLADGTQSNDVFDEFDYSEDALPRIQADYERRILSVLEATPPALLPDGSIAARIFEAGNQIHNIATEHQNNEGLLNRLATLRGEMWSIAREATPPAPKVMEEMVERAFRDGVRYGTICEVTDIDDAWRTSSVRAALTAAQESGE